MQKIFDEKEIKESISLLRYQMSKWTMADHDEFPVIPMSEYLYRIFGLSIDTLNKEIPMKVNTTLRNEYYINFYCPICGKQQKNRSMTYGCYCERCGQKLYYDAEQNS